MLPSPLHTVSSARGAPRRATGSRPRFWTGGDVPLLLGVALVALGCIVGVGVAALPPFAALIAVIGMIAGAYLFVSPEAAILGFCGIVTLLPFGVIPVKLGASLTFLDALLGIFTLVWLLRMLVKPDPPMGTSPDGMHTAIVILVVLWIAVSFLSFLMGTGLSVPPGDVLRYYLKIVLATLLFIVSLQTIRDARLLRHSIAALILGGASAAVIGLILYALPHTLATQILSSLHVVGYPSGANVLRFRVDFNHAQRAISTSVDPNVLGGLFVVTGALAISQWFARERVMPRWLAVACSFAILACLPLTYSRGAWISLAAAILIMATWHYRRLLVLFVVALFIFVQLPASHAFTAQLQSGVRVQDKAAGMRVGEINDSIRLIGRYPLFGVGFGSAPDRDIYVGVSNIYLLMAEETGLVGLALFVIILLMYLWFMFRALPRVQNPSLFAIALGTFSGSVGAMTGGMFDRYFFSFPHDIALFWFFLALSLAAVSIDRSTQAREASFVDTTT